MQLHPYDDYWVVLHPQSSRLICLNETGRYIWQAHYDGMPVAEIIEHLKFLPTKPKISRETEVRQLLASIAALEQETNAAPTFQANSACSRSQAIRVPEAEKPFQTVCYQLGSALIAIQAPLNIFHDLITPVVNHLVIPEQLQVHLLICLSNDVRSYLIQLTDKVIKLSTPDKLLERLLFEMLEAAYRVPKTLAVLHAGAVLLDNKALLFIAAQGSGKSTLVANLCTSGMTYLSDDICPLNENGELIPVPAPQAIKKGSWLLLRRNFPDILNIPVYQRLGHPIRYLPPASNTSGCWTQTWPVGLLIFPHYNAGAKPRIEALDPLEKLQQLTLSNSLRGDADLAELLQWLEKKPAYRLTYSHTEQVGELLSRI